MYARIEDGEVVEWPIYSLRQRFPDISFSDSVSADALPEGVVEVKVVAPPPFTAVQKPVTAPPTLQDGVWVQGWEIVDLTEDELDLKSQQAAIMVRNERNTRLSATDWRFRSDMTPSQEWKDYCQALRDVPSQEGFPFDVQWPAPPQD